MTTSYLYSRDVDAAPTLSTDEQHELARRYARERDPRDAQRLMLANLRLVLSIVVGLGGTRGNNLMDLIQEGNAGLMVAIDKFDPSRGATLATYATFWIRAYVIRHLMEVGRIVRSTSTREGRRRFFAHTLPRDVSLDAPVGRDEQSSGRGSLLDLVPDEEGLRPDVAAEEREEQDRLRAALTSLEKTLNTRDLAILENRLLCDAPKPLRQLGTKLSLSGERVRQLEQRILGRLRTLVTDDRTESLGRAA